MITQDRSLRLVMRASYDHEGERK